MLQSALTCSRWCCEKHEKFPRFCNVATLHQCVLAVNYNQSERAFVQVPFHTRNAHLTLINGQKCFIKLTPASIVYLCDIPFYFVIRQIVNNLFEHPFPDKLNFSMFDKQFCQTMKGSNRQSSTNKSCQFLNPSLGTKTLNMRLLVEIRPRRSHYLLSEKMKRHYFCSIMEKLLLKHQMQFKFTALRIIFVGLDFKGHRSKSTKPQ